MEDMGWVRDNFLDLVEYANGAADSEWGAWRVRAGHPTPFGLEYVEIGNENQGREYGERYRFVHSALKEKHPNLHYLADLSWTSVESLGDAQWDIEDRHYYSSPIWFRVRFNEYDNRDRSLPPLYLGEVAVTTGEAGPTRGNLLAALSEGVFLLGCERNADAVQMVSYAPLLGHVEGRTELTDAPPPWHAMIYFDGTRAYGTASYHLWKLFGQNRPDQIVSSAVTFPNAGPMAVRGQVGVGTWNTSAEFKDVRVERNGQVLYASDFANGAEDWNSERGRWSVEEGAYRQSRRAQGFSYVGEDDWSDYTLTLKARKLSGGEGFLVLFGRKGGDRYWWNLGGWGNREHGIELNQSPVGQRARGEIETDRWYDVKVQLEGRRIRCYLDGELIHDVTAPEPQNLYVAAGREQASGDLIVKAINFADEPAPATLRLNGVNLTGDGTATVLMSENLSDNNSLDEPLKVAPSEGTVRVSGGSLPHEFPPRSLTVLRLKTR
jgi:alpha-L-arabinofuranosidase